MRRIAQRVGLCAVGARFQRRELPCRAQRFPADDRTDGSFARADPVRRVMQQADRAIAIGAGRVFAMGGRDGERGAQRVLDRVELGPADLRHHCKTVAIAEQTGCTVPFRPPQRFGHQADRIEPVSGLVGPVVHLPHAHDHRYPFGVQVHPISPLRGFATPDTGCKTKHKGEACP